MKRWGVNAHARAGSVFFGIFVLRVDVGEASLNRIEFVSADAPVEEPVAAFDGIERPQAAFDPLQWESGKG